MLDPVVKEIRLPVKPDEAFRRFTEEIGSWWPMNTHSVSLEECQGVRFRVVASDARSGAEPVRTLVEEDLEGREHLWGTVRVWDPPHRVALSWHPGRNPEEAQEIEITFEATDGGTTVRLTHRGWEVLGERAEEVRGRYDEGWLAVLERFRG